MTVGSIWNADRAMAVFAHPDDAELHCYGMLKTLSLAGVAVKVLILTNGDRGVAVGKKAPRGLPATRMQETRAALAGVTDDVQTLSLPDGHLNLDGETMTAIETEFLRYGPDLVISHYHDRTGADHHDHRVTGAAVHNISYRKPFVRSLLTCEPVRPHTDFIPTMFVDITAHFVEKCSAIAMHKSQAGRVYLTEDYHRVRASRWVGLTHGHDAQAPVLYEAFRSEKLVIG